MREVYEETGILPEQVEFVETIRVYEIKEKTGNISVRYYLTRFKEEEKEINLECLDPEELNSVSWKKVEEVLELPNEILLERRKKVLQAAVQEFRKLNIDNTKWIPGNLYYQIS